MFNTTWPNCGKEGYLTVTATTTRTGMRLYKDGYTYDDGDHISDEIEDILCKNCMIDIPDEWIYVEQCQDCGGYEVDNPDDPQWSDIVVPLCKCK